MINIIKNLKYITLCFIIFLHSGSSKFHTVFKDESLRAMLNRLLKKDKTYNNLIEIQAEAHSSDYETEIKPF